MISRLQLDDFFIDAQLVRRSLSHFTNRSFRDIRRGVERRRCCVSQTRTGPVFACSQPLKIRGGRMGFTQMGKWAASRFALDFRVMFAFSGEKRGSESQPGLFSLPPPIPSEAVAAKLIPRHTAKGCVDRVSPESILIWGDLDGTKKVPGATWRPELFR